MTELETFTIRIGDAKSETYKRLAKDINKYSKEKDLYIKSVHYDRLDDTIIANVLFSHIPDEIFVL